MVWKSHLKGIISSHRRRRSNATSYKKRKNLFFLRKTLSFKVYVPNIVVGSLFSSFVAIYYCVPLLYMSTQPNIHDDTFVLLLRKTYKIYIC